MKLRQALEEASSTSFLGVQRVVLQLVKLRQTTKNTGELAQKKFITVILRSYLWEYPAFDWLVFTSRWENTSFDTACRWSYRLRLLPCHQCSCPTLDLV